MPQVLGALQIIQDIAWAAASAASAAGAPDAVAFAIADTVIVGGISGTVALTAVGIAEALKTPSPDALRAVERQAIPSRRRGFGISRLGGAFIGATA